MYLVVARVQPKAGEMDGFLEAFTAYRSVVLAEEPGTVFFDVHRDLHAEGIGEDRFVILEGFKDRAAYDSHQESSFRDDHLNIIRSFIEDASAEQFAKVEA